MKKTNKIFATVLLVAVIVSMMAVLPALTASAATITVAEEEEATYGKYVYQQASKAAPTVSNPKANVNGTKVPVFTQSTEGGVNVWTYDWKDTPAGTNPATQNFWAALGTSNTDVIIRDDSKYGAKNTDYFVIDFDLATDTVLPDEVFFNIRMYASGAASSLGAVGEYPAFGADADGRIYVANANGSNKHHKVIESGEKWTHVTFVYDFHPVTTTTTDPETGAVTTTTTITNMAYAYLDGYYVGTIGSMDANTARIYWMRMQQDTAMVADNLSYKIANYSVKTFEAGYNGPMTDSGLLSSGTPLAEIPDLKYCMENFIESPDGYGNEKIADIIRGEASIPVTDVDDLNGKLLDGDIVKVYKDVSKLRSAYVIKNKADDTPAQVTWIDANEVELGADGSLFAKPTVLAVKYDSVWAIVRGGALYSEGGASYYEGSGETAIINDPLWEAIPASGTNEVILFDDYTMIGRSYGISGSTSSSSSGNETTSGSLVFELNGHTLISQGKRAHLIVIKSSSAAIKFKNGGIIHNGGGNNLIMASTGLSQRTIFENCDITNNGTMIDHRTGAIYFIDSRITLKDSISNTKATGDGGTAVIVDGCTISATGESVIGLAQTNATGIGRYGSATLGVCFYNTTVTGSAPLVNGDIYANATGNTAAAYRANLVNHYITIDGCTIDISTSVVSEEIGSLPASGENVLTARIAVEMRNSTIDAKYLTYAYRRTNKVALVDFAENINVKDCDITIEGLSTGYAEQPSVSAEMYFTFDAACRFNKMPKDGPINTVTIALPADHVMAYTSNEAGYDVIVTSSFDPYTYQLGAEAPVEFYWNKAEGEVVDVTAAAPALDKIDGVYHYEWNEPVDNAYTTKLVKDYGKFVAKSNLTLYDYIHFNLFIPVDSYELLESYITVTGGVLDEETIVIDDVEYMKWQAKGITPYNADVTAITLALSIPTAYGEKVVDNSREFSVLDYAASILENNDTENASTDLIYALLNYLKIACAYDGKDNETAANVAAVLGERSYAMNTEGAKADALAGAEIAVSYGDALYLGVKGTAGDKFTVSYLDGEKTVTVTGYADAKGEAFFSFKACDFAKDITVTLGDASATVNLAGYYNKLDGKAEAQEMVAAIYNYSVAAAAYKATIAN